MILRVFGFLILISFGLAKDLRTQTPDKLPAVLHPHFRSLDSIGENLLEENSDRSNLRHYRHGNY
jgi:hypothetical protein